MIVGEGAAVIRCPARDILEFVLDLERYRQADTKIRHVYFAERRGCEGVIRYSARLRGLPTPSAAFAWRLVPYARLEIRSLGEGWLEGLLLDHFEGLFLCEQTAAGTRIVHRETFAFRPPLARLIEGFLGPWLARQVPEEVARMKHILEVDSPPARSPGVEALMRGAQWNT